VTPFPVAWMESGSGSEMTAITYVIKLAEEGVKEATVKNNLAGLRQ